MTAVLSDYESAAISEKDRALFRLVDLVNSNAVAVTQAEIDRVKDAGWSDEAIYDAITVCSLFRFFNTWTDAMGVRDMPAAMFARSGERLASKGYLPADDSGGGA